MTDHPTVALLGTGLMGSGMARNIAGAGMPLRVWNRTTAKAEQLADVADVAAAPAEAVAGADVVVTMLHDADSTQATMKGLADALGPDTVWLQQATVGVAGQDLLADTAADLGVGYVDAPVLGTRKPAEDGALVVLASGPEELRDPVAPVLDAIGSRTMWLGAAGQGSRLKLVANAWVATVLEGVSDSMALARDLGLDPQLFLDAVRGGALDAPYVQLKGSAMLEGSFETAFALSGLLKDLDLILEAAGDAGTGLEPLRGVRAHVSRAVEAGHGDKDMAATWLTH